ncbi:hypothetical protein QOZ80_7BG0595860 [Eleusine coracana subsp. coracana]|nr:hypothetical protein QOZ80_7BG0595860 [Eleusine coracana subsp. coracana]
MAASIRRPGFLREAELRLLRCTVTSPATGAPPLTPVPAPQHPLGAAAAATLAAVEAGDYGAALAAAAPHLLPASASAGPPGSAAQFYTDLAAAVQAFLRGAGDRGGAGETADEEHDFRCAVVLSAAVAALLAFTQQNVTGPPGTFSAFPFWTSSLGEGWYNNLGVIWDSWASDNLSSFGSHVDGKFSLLQFIVFAELLFTSIQTLDLSDGLSVSWWLFRVSMLQQNILDELSSSLFDQVQVYKNKMLGHFGELKSISAYWGYLLYDEEGSYFVSAALLEAGIAGYKYGRVDASRLYLDSAQEACGLHLSLTGILGFRTIHQVDAKSQMVLVAMTSKSATDDGQITELTEAQNDVASLKSARSSVPVESDEFCDILRTPKLMQDGTGSESENTRAEVMKCLRSLARSAYNRNDFYTSKILWESALALNSLFPDGWFAYGTAAWKDKDLDKAVDAFSRSVQIDPENGEAWNNIACLHMIRGKSQAAVQAFREAVKFKRNSWEIWENYSKVALDTGNVRLTLEALKMVLNLSSNKRFNADILDKVMALLEEQNTPHSDTKEDDPNSNTSSDVNKETRQSNHLLDMTGDILQQIVRSGGSNADIWGLYARWHKIKGNLIPCSEALLKQVRSLQGSGLWHDQKKFTKYAQASLQLCKVYMEISSSSGNRRELLLAEMHLKSSLKQATDFSDTEEYKALNNYLQEIKNLIGGGA